MKAIILLGILAGLYKAGSFLFDRLDHFCQGVTAAQSSIKNV